MPLGRLRRWIGMGIVLSCCAGPLGAEPLELRVMTFNLWQGGDAGGEPLERSAEVIRGAGADVVGLQETRGESQGEPRPDRAQDIARRLEWHYFDQGEGCGIVSRWKITRQSPSRSGVRIEAPCSRAIWVFNVHLAHAPYQPYQLLRISYNDAPFIEGEEQAIAEAERARGAQVEALLADIRSVAEPGAVVFVTGDFNEPSADDWTPAIRRAGRCPIAVRWPSTSALQQAGFLDTYRHVHPNPLTAPGYTWTPITAEDDPADRHDRIDFVFMRGEGTRVRGAQIIGERAERADLVLSPYPSDHRAVVATVLISSE